MRILERQAYPGIQSLKLEELPEQKMPVYTFSKGTLSHLEEHQLSGYFGYRRNWATSHVEKPHSWKK